MLIELSLTPTSGPCMPAASGWQPNRSLADWASNDGGLARAASNNDATTCQFMADLGQLRQEQTRISQQTSTLETRRRSLTANLDDWQAILETAGRLSATAAPPTATLTVVVPYCPLVHAPGVPKPAFTMGKLPRSARRGAHDCRDERGAAEEDQDGEDRDAEDAVLSGHEAEAPGVDEQAHAEHDDACPETTLSECRERHRVRSMPVQDG
jgi:hypothetical protein